MAKRSPRRLVIDADVARSAGDTQHPLSSACRRFLETVLEVGHHAVMPTEIHQEWRNHHSRYSRKWLTKMHGRRRVDRVQIGYDSELRKSIDDVVGEMERQVVEKDVHLVEAAIATDLLVNSRDERARAAFRILSDKVVRLRPVVWVNPTIREERPVCWLRGGAKADSYRRLGAGG